MESKNDSACLRNYPKSWKAGARILSCLVLFAGLIVSRASGQANPVPNLPTPTITQPPLSYLYLSFLISQNHLDKAAATREAEGKDGAWLRNHFQDRLGFTGSQFSVIRSTGLRLESELKELQARVAVAIQAERTAYPRALEQSDIMHPESQALKDLDVERDDLIQREVTKLNHDLGPEASAKLQSFIESRFSQNSGSTIPSVAIPLNVPGPATQQPTPHSVQP